MITYRRDIDGLRAVAVLPVILFHLNSPIFPGGYVGVDVFFVISGYLITATLVKEIRAGDFSIIRFYERRCRRILPALFAMIAFCLVVGSLIFLPDDLRNLGKSVFATSIFVSNVLFWKEIDYFAPSAELLPLLHTWSLAVEEQFYIFFPLLLWALGRWWKGAFVLPILILAVLSLAISIVQVGTAPSAAYYLLPSRAWELLTGSLIAVGAVRPIAVRWAGEIIAAAGLILIMGSALLLHEADPFPGLLALPPVLGAAALIHAGTNSSTLAGRLLSLPPFVSIGLISYSLYLWHWPLIVFIRYAAMGNWTAQSALLAIIATFVLGYLSWRFIEQPIRNRRLVPRGRLFAGSGASIVLAGVAGVLLVSARGLPSRFPEAAALEARIEKLRKEDEDVTCILNKKNDRWAGLPHCALTHGPRNAVLLWGDSHAFHYASALRELNGRTSNTILLYGMTACPPIFGIVIAKRPNCGAVNARVPDLIRQYRISRVVLSGFWQAYPRQYVDDPAMLSATVQRLRGLGIQVDVIGDSPYYSFSEVSSLATLNKRNQSNEKKLFLPIRNDPAFKRGLERIAGADHYLDPLPWLCRAPDQCLAMEGDTPLMIDNNHLSRFGAAKVLTHMKPLVD